MFPWDYKAAELGSYSTDLAIAFIDFFSLIGWAYDLKTASNELIVKRTQRTGDGTQTSEHGIWGWDDSDLSNESRKLANVINKIHDQNLYPFL